MRLYPWANQCVMATDFDALQAEAQALREEVAALRARVVVAWPEEVQMVLALADRIDEANEKPIAIALDGARILRDLTRLNGKSISAETLRRIDLVLAALRSHDFHGIIASTIGDNWREEVDAMRCELRELLDEGKES
jgi:MoxR-like ATPase